MKTNYIAISGVKNSGKTTLISKLIPKLKSMNLKVATIKHDGHEFEPDVLGTDSYIHRKSGADGVGIFSDGRFMIIKEEKTDLKNMLTYFSDMDLVILEGFKDKDILKIELVRHKVSNKPYCKEENILFFVTDSNFKTDKKKLNFNQIDEIALEIVRYFNLENR